MKIVLIISTNKIRKNDIKVFMFAVKGLIFSVKEQYFLMNDTQDKNKNRETPLSTAVSNTAEI